MAFTILLMPGVLLAERVTQVTVEDVGGGALNAYSPVLDQVSAAFRFGLIDDTATVPDDVQDPAAAIDGVTGPIPCYPTTIRAPDGSPIPGPICFKGDLGPIDASVASPVGFIDFTEADLIALGVPFSEADAFTNGFRFTGVPFAPITEGPISLDISISGSTPVLTLLNGNASPGTDFPFSGIFGSNITDVPAGATKFTLPPQAADPDPATNPCASDAVNIHIPFTVMWVNRRGETDDYNYKVAWTHCITTAENDANAALAAAAGVTSSRFDQRANWRLEGIMTTEDSVAPVISSTTPVSSVTISSNSSVSVTFNEPMDPASVTLSSFIVGLTSSPTVTECSAITSSTDNKTFACLPPAINGQFTNNSNFTLTLDNTITDDSSAVLGGGTTTNAFAGTSFTFDVTTVDTISPTHVSNSPADAATDVPVATGIDVVFDEQMLNALTAAAISLTANGTTVPTSVFSADSITFTITPDSDLAFNIVYTINIAALAQDSSGNLLNPYTPTTFTTSSSTSLVVDGATVAIDAGSTASIVNLEVLALSEVPGTQPAGFSFTNELFISYIINGVTGGQETVTITFPEPITDKVIFKVIGGVYTQLVEGNNIGQYQVVSSDTITMTILDNDGTNGTTATQDSDATPGIIADPLVATIVDTRPTPGSLGGCSLTSTEVSVLERVDMLLLIGLILWYGVARRKTF